ncbi:TPA: hypothetical protein N2902_000169 [Vibrio parahaemolyticus]|uniref:ParE-like toxin domain-containing protein n=1 Tax=Vibrio parahaemolyticus TaxID=670 RepID=A0AA47JLQ5_VIBPH|nr:hypothetical protein [Vibrio parahaemolyticus]HDY7614422.1 hypothetical protein [Vibrio vulnificus]EGR3328471.1 hypothetical protein [Vibrio parahaemolyticus]EGR9044508.1 hypothetical protein [Vibrio parahaemolyticus]EII3078586.1 hypothetical protein [Vibrio parahaemolyticus]EII3080931.1 hypothetical protein [Vibrio parahaemolyticus]
MSIKHKGKVNTSVYNKALKALQTVRPRRMKESGFLSIKVNYQYRLLNRGKGWELMTHERYNRYV